MTDQSQSVSAQTTPLPLAQSVVTVGEGPRAARFGNHLPFALIAGPCAMESPAHAKEMAAALVEITASLGLDFVFKASFDKANRTSASGRRGMGMAAALPVFADIQAAHGIAVVTDVHDAAQCAPVAEVADMLQIPAFLCRQTDLLLAAAATGRVVNVKKGQFLAPWDMKHVAGKVLEGGNDRILVTERGASFGYNALVTDFRGLPLMAQQIGAPIIFDATHSVQQPGGQGGSSGGQREYAPVLARAAIAVGVAGLFIETHDKPDIALSDGPNMIPLHEMKDLLLRLMQFDQVAKI